MQQILCIMKTIDQLNNKAMAFHPLQQVLLLQQGPKVFDPKFRDHFDSRNLHGSPRGRHIYLSLSTLTQKIPKRIAPDGITPPKDFRNRRRRRFQRVLGPENRERPEAGKAHERRRVALHMVVINLKPRHRLASNSSPLRLRHRYLTVGAILLGRGFG